MTTNSNHARILPILAHMESKKTKLVFDIDGCLAIYAYGYYNHNACAEKDWNEHIRKFNVYDAAVPSERIRDWLTSLILAGRKTMNDIYVCSHADSGQERLQKQNFIGRHYHMINPANIFFIPTGQEKWKEILKRQKTEKRIRALEQDIVLIDDTVSELTAAQENSRLATAHVSVFFQNCI